MVTLQSMFQTIVQSTVLTNDGDGGSVFAVLDITRVCVDGFRDGGSWLRASCRDMLFHPEIGIFAFLDRDGFVAEWADGHSLILQSSVLAVWASMSFQFPMVLTIKKKQGCKVSVKME